MSTPLSKFGVPLDGGQRKVMSQPKLQHKFRVMLNNFGTTSSDGNNVCFDADTVSRPNVTFDVTALRKFGVPSYYVQGHKYDTIKLVIRDVVSNDSVRGVCRQIQKQLDVHRRISTFSAQNYANYHFKMIIETLGGANPDDTMGNFIRDTSSDVIGSLLGNTAANYSNDALGSIDGTTANPTTTIDRWVCLGCVLTGVDFDELDYSSSKYLNITMTIQPTECVLYDEYKAMYKDSITSFSDSADAWLNVADSIFGAVDLGSSSSGGGLISTITSWF